MALGLALRVSWICLLLSSGACFPATKGDYRYPYTPTWGSSGRPDPRSKPLSERSRLPLQPQAAPYQAGTGNQFPSSLGAAVGAAGSSQSYEPNRFIVTYDSSSNKPSRAPSFSVQHRPAAGPGGNTNVAASSPVYSASFAYPAETAGTMAASSSLGAGPGPYAAAPATYPSYRPDPYAYVNPAVPGVAGGADSSFYDPSKWMPSSGFPDFSVWETDNQEMPQSVSDPFDVPPPPIIQSWNGYQRAREDLSHTKYSLDYYDPPAFPLEAAKAPSKNPPVKDGRKV
ncbi:uncharacterized protein LOC127373011 [Dicentrarchus labrax]|uniref:uncharacterized protein LOC127373011 n=1 Tax=Dicentrarchus labrax TaxID=13489 RepID=UPI0021F5F762|nr:uncharacterized protein LOC127373011 [Dicentrarchus labrax]